MEKIATIYIVATPIGTLSDLSPHAQRVLADVGFIVCEDTRHTAKLLHHFGIQNRLESLHVHNEKDKVESLISRLLQNDSKTAALVTDAGTPGISDPGSFFIAAAHEKGIRILNVPGPSSLTCALASSGFIAPRSIFSGFLPRTQKEQFQEFERWKAISPCVAVFFESPRRILKTLEHLQDFFHGYLKICVSREISKQFEEHKTGSIEEVIHFFKMKKEICGEFVVCVNVEESVRDALQVTAEQAAKEAVALSETGDQPLKMCCKQMAQKYSLSSKEIYSIAVRYLNHETHSD